MVAIQIVNLKLCLLLLKQGECQQKTNTGENNWNNQYNSFRNEPLQKYEYYLIFMFGTDIILFQNCWDKITVKYTYKYAGAKEKEN